MKYHTLFLEKLGKMLQNLSSAAVVIGALRVKITHQVSCNPEFNFFLKNFVSEYQK